MEKTRYEEMTRNLERTLQRYDMRGRNLYLFGHCSASEILVDLLAKKGWKAKAILDNNPAKQGSRYRKTPIVPPEKILGEGQDGAMVYIVARAAASMEQQLRRMGYAGPVERLVEYDSYAEYSLSTETIRKKWERLERGIRLLEGQKERHPGRYRIYCPFPALGDVYYTMAYLPYFLEGKGVSDYAVFTIGDSCGQVAELFGAEHTEALSQQDMDESVQAALYTEAPEAYVAHHDRPYTVNLGKALYVKKMTLETIYRCGVFGLGPDQEPQKPSKRKPCSLLEQIEPGRAVILSPYAKSVTSISEDCWLQIIGHYEKKGYEIFTNTAGDEKALPGTIRLAVKLAELQSAAERAGTFIGLRSGLCDVIKDAACRKIALYPDRYYSDTKWKMEEIYHLEGWENIVVR